MPGRFLRSLTFFDGISEEGRNALSNICKVADYPKGSDIAQAHKQADRLFIVLNGWVKVSSANSNGKEKGLMLLTQGDGFGADAIFDGGTFLFNARAETKTQALEILTGALQDMVRHRTEPAMVIMRVLSREIKERRIMEACLRHEHDSQRVACLLLRLTAWMKGKGGTFRMPYKKSVASAQLGMDQGTFSRALAGLKRLGVSSKEGEITFDDFSALSKQVCIDCPFSNHCKGNRLGK